LTGGSGHVSAPSRCPACAGIVFRVRQVLPDLVTRTCSSCGLVSSSIDRTGPAVPEFALVDQEAYLRSVGETRRLQAGQILEALNGHVPPGSRLLDVGCSFGFFPLAAREAGFQVRGIEPDPQAYEHARRLLGDDVVVRGILDGTTAPPRSADIVSTLDVVEHIAPEEHEAFAGTVRETLVPGGVWVIKVPSTEGLYYKLSDLMARMYTRIGASLIRRMWQTRYEYPHLVYFSLHSMSMWLERFGFQVVAHRYLPEVPSRTVIDRLTTDGDINRLKAYAVAPAVLGVNVVEALRRKSDGLVVFARPRP
jgi:cyclopropane fatty-acyl-phospholipid synthase-like methyltransferase